MGRHVHFPRREKRFHSQGEDRLGICLFGPAGLRAHQFNLVLQHRYNAAMRFAIRKIIFRAKNEYRQRRDDGRWIGITETYLPKGPIFSGGFFNSFTTPDRVFAHQLAREARVATVPPVSLS